MEKDLRVLLAGLLIGFFAGILTAPEKGKRTRKKLKYGADLMKDQIEDAVEAAMEKAKKVKKTLT